MAIIRTLRVGLNKYIAYENNVIANAVLLTHEATINPRKVVSIV